MQELFQSKKGQLQIQFNWIFVLIVGTVLLIFFISLITSQTNASETKVSVKLAEHFKTIISTTGQKTGTVKKYTTPYAELNFVCDSKEGIYQYSVGNLKAKDTKFDIMFSPDHLVGKDLLTWTQDFAIPYKVETVLYLTNKKHQYIFYRPNRDTVPYYYSEVLSNFADNLTVFQSYSAANSGPTSLYPSKTSNMAEYIYIIFAVSDYSNMLPVNKILDGDNVKIRVITPTDYNDPFSIGQVAFMDKKTYEAVYFKHSSLNPDNYTSTYVGKASLYGAIFSGTKASYDCQMTKAFKKLRMVTLLQSYRLKGVLDKVTYNCKLLLGGVDGIAGPIQDLNKTAELLKTGEFNSTLAESVFENLQKLKSMNEELALEGNCPLIY